MANPIRKAPDVKTLAPGMTVYLLPYDAIYAEKHKARVVEAKIVKIGRKYVSVKKKTDPNLFPLLMKFDFTDNYLEKAGEYGRDFNLFFSMKEIDEYFLHYELVGRINDICNYAFYLNNHQLKQIADLLEKGKRIYKGLEANNQEV